MPDKPEVLHQLHHLTAVSRQDREGEHFGKIDNDVCGFMVDMANDLVSTMEQESPLFGTLTRTALGEADERFITEAIH